MYRGLCIGYCYFSHVKRLRFIDWFSLIDDCWCVVDEEVIARQLAEKQQLESDVELLNQIIEMSAQLSTPHDVCTFILLHHAL